MTEQTIVGMGCDTHLDFITAAVIDSTGRPVDQRRCNNTARGHAELWRMCQRHNLTRVGVEGASGYGQPLAVYLAARGVEVVDVPARVTAAGRDTGGKTDPGDAVAVARAMAAGRGYDWAYNPAAEALRVLVHRRETLVRQQTADVNHLRGLLAEADPERAAGLGRLNSIRQLEALSRVRYSGNTHRTALADTIRSIARDCIRRRQDIDRLTGQLEGLVPESALRMIAETDGCGIVSAAILYAELAGTTGFTSHAKFAAWAGAAPIPVSSGRTDRHRLNRGGNRQANRVLHIIIVTQHRQGGEAADYINRRRAEGKTTKEAIRAAKRHLARRLWKNYLNPNNLT